MNISIQMLIFVVGGVASIIGIYVKMKVDNARHEENTKFLKNEVVDLKRSQKDHELKIEQRLDKIYTLIIEIKDKIK